MDQNPPDHLPCESCGEDVPVDEYCGNDRADGTTEFLCPDCYQPDSQNCIECGSTLGIDCGDAEPDHDDRHCSKGCYLAGCAVRLGRWEWEIVDAAGMVYSTGFITEKRADRRLAELRGSQ